MKTEHYIEQLLYRYQCVAIPGFGAFLAELRPAYLDTANHTFYPPKKSISFNPHLRSNDGLLASHIALAEKISFEESLEKIAAAVFQWKSTLHQDNAISFQNIGNLSVNHEGNIIFEAADQVNYFTGAFGLGQFMSPAIKREILAVVPDAAEGNEDVIVLVPQKTASYQWMKYAAVFAISLGALGFFGNQYNQKRIAAETQVVQAEVQKEVQDRIQQATFFIDNPLPEVSLPVKELEVNTPYHIVAGAFADASNADRAVRQLSLQGYESRRLKQNRFGLYPVIYGSYEKYAEAQAALREIRRNSSNEAWLLVTKR